MRRSALPRASLYHGAIPMAAQTWWAFAVALLVVLAGTSTASSAWSPESDGIPVGRLVPEIDFQYPDPMGDATPEDYAVEKLVSLIEQVGREKDRSRSQAKSEEESYDDVVSYDEEEVSPQVATGGKGSGFSYLFPPSEQRSEFAVNPSDPLYYSAPDGIRSSPKELETREDMEDQEEAPSPIGRFPEVKPIKFTTDFELPHEEIEETARPQPAEPVRPKTPETVRPIPPESIQARPNVRERPTQHHLFQSDDVKKEKASMHPITDNYYVYLTAIIAGCSAAGIVGVIAAGIFYYKLQRNAKAAADVEYPAYGVTGPNQEASAVAAAAAAASVPPPTGPTGGSTSPISAGDRRLAQSAQMYHYQHQKQQIIAMESRATNERHGSVSEVDSEEENEEGDYTVYECPGLAPTGEMEVKNPLFHDDPTPATPSGGIREQRDAGGKQQ